MSSRFLAIALVLVLAGCLGSTPVVEPPSPPSSPTVRVVDERGQPVAFAQVTAFVAGDPIATLAADAQGVLARSLVPPGTQTLAFGAAARASVSFAAGAVPSLVTLPVSSSTEPEAFLRFLPHVSLICPSVDPPPYSCSRFGESVLEIAGDGTVWESATSAVGRSPPIWTSRDGGKTFQLLEGRLTGVVRDATGIEGDFAIDEAGNVYFFDILAGAAYFTSYTAAGDHRWTLPHAFPPLVDRPWVRAGKADEVFILYNTGTASQFYKSLDGGKTFDLQGGYKFPCPLGNLGQNPAQRQHLAVAAICSVPQVWTSKDAGATWSEAGEVPLPKGHVARGYRMHSILGVGMDEVDRVYVAYQHATPSAVEPAPDNDRLDVSVVRLERGTWAGPWLASPAGINYMPWLAAGRDGSIAIGFYHAEGDNETEATEWRLMVSASIDADAATPHFQYTIADDEVLTTGILDRQLGDFLEVRYAPDGHLGVSYSKVVLEEGPTATPQNVARFIASDGGLKLGPVTFLNGPRVG